VLVEPSVETGPVDVQGVGVLHRELPDPEQTGLGTGLVAELGVDLVPDLGQLAIGEQLGGEDGEDLLLGHAEDQFHIAPVDQPEQVVPHEVVAARLPPDLGGMEGGQDHLLATDGVHLLPDDPGDLETDTLAEREHGVGAGGELADEPSPDQELVTHGLGVGGSLAEGWYECL
jgi:hypothetical protein